MSTAAMRADNLHIVHVTECMAGGTLGFLVQAVGTLHEAGVKQTLLFSRRPDSPKDISGLFPSEVEQHELPPARGTHWQFTKGLANTLREVTGRRAADAVHLHSSKAGFVGRMVLARSGLATHCYYSPHGLSFLNQRRRIASRLYLGLEHLASKVLPFQPVGCGQGEAQLLERISQRAAFVLENPVPDEFFRITRHPTTPPMVLTVGRVCEQKAPERFAELALQAEIHELGARFVWVGGGDEQGEALLRGAGVTVTGWLPPDAVREHMSQATLYVQTSHWEGMPLSVVQAMAAGLPCLVSDVVGNRDAVAHGRTGLIAADTADLYRQLAHLLEQPSERARLGLAAQQDAQQRFGRDRFLDSLKTLYGLRDTRRPTT
jgi:glycosyltransferase involved in cell wall biosynthesis